MTYEQYKHDCQVFKKAPNREEYLKWTFPWEILENSYFEEEFYEYCMEFPIASWNRSEVEYEYAQDYLELHFPEAFKAWYEFDQEIESA